MIKSLIAVNGKHLALIGLSDEDCVALRQREPLIAEMDFIDPSYAKSIVLFLRVPNTASENIINTVLDAGVAKVKSEQDVEEVHAVAMPDHTLAEYGQEMYRMRIKHELVSILLVRTETDDHFVNILRSLERDHSSKFNGPEDAVYPTDPELN